MPVTQERELTGLDRRKLKPSNLPATDSITSLDTLDRALPVGGNEKILLLEKR
jgi:hypothetical protein